MTDQITEQQVYKIALTNELKGASFYSSMSRVATSKETADIFHKLSEEEREHHRLFQMLLDKTGAAETKTYDNKTSNFLKTLFSHSVFPQDVESLAASITPEQALAMGIQAEKDSILLYHELSIQTEDTEVKQKLGKLLQEEKMHLVELREQLEEMKAR